MVWSAVDARDERVAWAQAHEAALDLAIVDLRRLSGTVSVDPGRQLVIDVDLELGVPDPGIDELVFSLNPAMEVESVRLDGEEILFSHALGLLSVAPPSPLAPGSETTLSVRARGVPDPRFGYLDSAVWALDETLLGMPIVLQGEQASLFEGEYVALDACGTLAADARAELRRRRCPQGARFPQDRPCRGDSSGLARGWAGPNRPGRRVGVPAPRAARGVSAVRGAVSPTFVDCRGR